ncbi:MAG: hypothetical protein HY319_31565 [Armatimonadetes bacterium]|nr:hypothetical protein [Armatimonadota bacterium]
MFKVETDRHPGRKIWFGSLQDTIAGFELRGQVRMKPRMLQLGQDHWVRVDGEEVLYLEEAADGRAYWVTLRGTLHDLDGPDFESALEKATRSSVLVRVSPRHAVAPGRILGIRLKRRGYHELEVEGPDGDQAILPLEPRRLRALEECLDAIHLGGGFLITGPDELGE